MKNNVFYFEKIMPCIDRYLQETEEKIYKRAGEVSLSAYVTKEPVDIGGKDGYQYKPLKEGEVWGGLFDCAIMKLEFTVPDCLDGKRTVLRLDLGGEALLYSSDSTPLRGLTSKTDSFDVKLGSPSKTEYLVSEQGEKGKKYLFFLDAGCNDLFGRYLGGAVKFAYLAEENYEVKMLWHDMRILRALSDVLPEKSARRYSVIYAMFDAHNACVNYTEKEVKKARAILKKELEKKGGSPSLEISALGHSHLDLAWLWPIRETKRKALRTFSTALYNIAEYPDYIFCASQPQQYEWVKENSPYLFEEIKKAIKAGRIDPVGALWVEPDLNVTGGESLVRHIMYGNKFYRENFDIEVDNAWLPDVFGFNAALPQILSKSGIKNLLTIKLSWNRFTRFPHHSFVWQGIGPGEVLVHMPPEGTYNSAATPYSVDLAEKSYIEKGLSRHAMLLYGIGDGGGGPGETHLENLERMKNLDGLPPVKQEKASEFFKKLNKERDRLPVYRGEMYLEKHQGTYTTQSHNKRFNRLCETSLLTAEYLSALAAAKKPYPEKELEEIWHEVLLYQFHDILPGSSIARVYEESVQRYGNLLCDIQKIKDSALNSFGADRDAIFNPSPFAREEIYYLGKEAKRLTAKPFSKCELKPVKGKVKAKENSFSNGIIKVIFDGNGGFSVTDLRNNRKTVLSGSLPVYFDDGDCWDISDNCYLKEHGEFLLKDFSDRCDGASAAREQTLVFGKSVLKQVITLDDGADFVRVKNFADWQEDGKLLRAEFLTDVVSQTVDCDIQFGRLTRTASENDIKDFAVNEICAQKWVDYYDAGGGAAVINDCKYGYRVKDSKITVTLLRAPDYPGKGADRGQHEFTYLVYLHGEKSAPEQKAYNLIYPVFAAPKDIPDFPFDIDCPHTVIESIKKCQYDNSVIVRIYENRGAPSEGRIKGCNKVIETDMTEKGGRETDKLVFAPFEIKTLKLI